MDRAYSISERVVKAVARKTDTEPLQLPSLYSAVDPDALEVFADENVDTEVSFEYAGCTVTVDGNSVHVERSVPGQSESERDGNTTVGGATD